MDKKIHEENRLSWNAATVAHNSHKGDQAAFFRRGGSTLFPEERELLGDVNGLSVVHLQCNSGQDSLSIARLGASVTGVDISDTAIDFARSLSQESGIPATFHRMDVYDWLAEAAHDSQRFDIVFCSYGALCWLSDLPLWAQGIAAVLKPGGRFIVIDFHPVCMLYEWDMERRYPYFTEGRAFTEESGVSDYVALSDTGLLFGTSGEEGVKDFKNPHRSHLYSWNISEILGALLGSGLTLTEFKEYPYSNGFKPFQNMQELPDQRWQLPPEQPNLPLMYSIVAQKAVR
ncbi:class I SAM-dependent methyltransferase [Thermosporothrix hazakensis]|jgi:SAM-dependent methyltransferase|nr:class I SAM-dependent methyltransferase [Thermosporothrix hazakensis]